MNPAERNDHSPDDRCLSFGQLLGLTATCCTSCLVLGRVIGMGWVSSIAFAYVGGAALVIVGCLVALRLMDGGVLSPKRQPERADEWSTGRHIDTARWSVVARDGAAAAPALKTVSRRIGSDSVLDARPQHRNIL